MDAVESMDKSDRDFLESAIKDYNEHFGTSYEIADQGFENYYRDASMRMKNRDLDILIVVNMFLTGFDATMLNTLWVDKNLKMHGLVQAFSRTNRILNSVKTFGNIVCFRPLEAEVNKAIGLFGDETARGVVLIRPYKDYLEGYDHEGKHYSGYLEMIEELQKEFPPGKRVTGETKTKEFINLFSAILRLRNLLTSFDEFDKDDVLEERVLQDYQSVYLDEYQDTRNSREKEDIQDDVVFEIELIKQEEIDIDYVIAQVKQAVENNQHDTDFFVSIQKTVDSSITLREKKELIEDFIKSLGQKKTDSEDVESEWDSFVEGEKVAKLEKIISEENLNREKALKFVEESFREGQVSQQGTGLADILPPMSRFGQAREQKKYQVLCRLEDYLTKYHDVVSHNFVN